MLRKLVEGLSPMDLRAAIKDVLGPGTRALTFEDVVKGVGERLEGEIRATLNDLADKKQILRHIGGKNHPWRYQAIQIKRRKA
jgi:hypothetical protein